MTLDATFTSQTQIEEQLVKRAIKLVNFQCNYTVHVSCNFFKCFIGYSDIYLIFINLQVSIAGQPLGVESARRQIRVIL